MTPEQLREAARIMRSHNRPPADNMLMADYHAARTIYALADALEEMADAQDPPRRQLLDVDHERQKMADLREEIEGLSR